jgi:hypothetical protein
VTEVTITDPHHALYGQRLELVSSSSARGPRHVTVALADGRRRSVRRAATDLGEDWPADPLGTASALPRISVRTLLPLARCLRGLLSSSTEEVPHDSNPAQTHGATPQGPCDRQPGRPGAAASLGGAAAGMSRLMLQICIGRCSP